MTNAFLYRIKTTTALNAPDGMVPIGFLQIKWRRYARSRRTVIMKSEH